MTYHCEVAFCLTMPAEAFADNGGTEVLYDVLGEFVDECQIAATDDVVKVVYHANTIVWDSDIEDLYGQVQAFVERCDGSGTLILLGENTSDASTTTFGDPGVDDIAVVRYIGINVDDLQPLE